MENLCDLHTHSLFSRHAMSSITENVEYAQSIGLKILGLSDHQPDPSGWGASEDSFFNLKVVPKVYKGMHVLKGIEINAGPQFKDFIKDKFYLDRLDYAVSSFHTYDYKTFGSKEDNENYYIESMSYDLVKIIGHIDDGHYPIDFERVIKAAKANNKLIEINNSSILEKTPRIDALKNSITVIKLCRDLKCPVILNSDAHIKYDIGGIEDAYNTCKEYGLSDDLIVNTNIDLFKKYFNI